MFYGNMLCACKYVHVRAQIVACMKILIYDFDLSSTE